MEQWFVENTYARTHTSRCTRAHTHTHTLICLISPCCDQTWNKTLINWHKCAHTRTHTHARTHAYTRTHTHTHTCAWEMHGHVCWCTHSNAHASMLAEFFVFNFCNESNKKLFFKHLGESKLSKHSCNRNWTDQHERLMSVFQMQRENFVCPTNNDSCVQEICACCCLLLICHRSDISNYVLMFHVTDLFWSLVSKKKKKKREREKKNDLKTMYTLCEVQSKTVELDLLRPVSKNLNTEKTKQKNSGAEWGRGVGVE